MSAEQLQARVDAYNATIKRDCVEMLACQERMRRAILDRDLLESMINMLNREGVELAYLGEHVRSELRAIV